MGERGGSPPATPSQASSPAYFAAFRRRREEKQIAQPREPYIRIGCRSLLAAFSSSASSSKAKDPMDRIQCMRRNCSGSDCSGDRDCLAGVPKGSSPPVPRRATLPNRLLDGWCRRLSLASAGLRSATPPLPRSLALAVSVSLMQEMRKRRQCVYVRVNRKFCLLGEQCARWLSPGEQQLREPGKEGEQAGARGRDFQRIPWAKGGGRRQTESFARPLPCRHFLKLLLPARGGGLCTVILFQTAPPPRFRRRKQRHLGGFFKQSSYRTGGVCRPLPLMAHGWFGFLIRHLSRSFTLHNHKESSKRRKIILTQAPFEK